MQSVKEAILDVVSIGPKKGMTTADIFAAYEGNYYTAKAGPKISYDALRGRVYELADAGKLLRSGERKNERGQSATVFTVRPEGKKKVQVKATKTVAKAAPVAKKEVVATCPYGNTNCPTCKTGTYAR